MRYETDLPRTTGAPSRARKSLNHWYEASLSEEELYRTTLLASELVTNAVVHGRGIIRLRAELDDDRVLVEVLDEGSGFEHQVGEIPLDQLYGRGLAIVDAEASRWGIRQGSTRVWFEIERTGPRLGAGSRPQD